MAKRGPKPNSVGKESYAKEGVMYYRLQWGDVVLYEFLTSIGLTPHKSLTMGSLAIPDEFFFDFLRGSYDGDGCFYSYYDPRWKNSFMFYLTFVSASEEHILWIQRTCYKLLGVKGHAVRSGRRTLMTTIRYAKQESLEVLTHMYLNSEVICLKRKRLKIERALGIVGRSLPTALVSY